MDDWTISELSRSVVLSSVLLSHHHLLETAQVIARALRAGHAAPALPDAQRRAAGISILHALHDAGLSGLHRARPISNEKTLARPERHRHFRRDAFHVHGDVQPVVLGRVDCGMRIAD